MKIDEKIKNWIKRNVVLLLLLCMLIGTFHIVQADSVKLSDLPAGTVIMIGGHSWNVLDPSKGYLQSYHHVGNPCAFDPDNTNIFNPSDANNIGYYLNTTFFNSPTAEGKAMIMEHKWSTNDTDNTALSSVSCKIGIISNSEYYTYKSYTSHAVTA